jgi:hypothetical protein
MRDLHTFALTAADVPHPLDATLLSRHAQAIRGGKLGEWCAI